MKDEKLAFYSTVTLAIIALIAGIAINSAALVALCAAFAMLSFLLDKSWYIIEALFFSHSNVIELCGKYELDGSRDVAVARNSYSFSATAVALLEGASKPVNQKDLEGLIARTGFAFKYIMHIKAVSASKVLDTLNTKRAMKEIELSRLEGSAGSNAKRNMIKREIEALSNDIDMISNGAPLKMVRYISTTATAQSKIAAEETAKRQIRELMSGFSAVSGSESRLVSGTELIDAINIGA